MDILNSSTFKIVCKTDVIMVEPPGVPKVIRSLPFFSTMVGVMELNMRFSGAILLASAPVKPNIFGTPALLLKSSISLFRKKPNSEQNN